MADLRFRAFLTALVAAFALAGGAPPVSAQTEQFYTPPKVLKQAAPSVAIAGTGSVQLKVFVHKDGSVGAVQVEKSTNRADEAAALDIAKHSTYKAGARDAKPVDAFYTMVLKFSGSSVVNDTGTSSNELVGANALIRGGKYGEARTEIEAYLTGHPGDTKANALLGVADEYLNESAAAAAAFDQAGTVPDQFKVVAAKAYADAAVEALKARNNDQAIALAGKALAYQQNVNTLYIRGTAYANAQRYPEAIADLEKAKAQATAGHADAKSLNAIDTSLAMSYILAGQADKGVALAKSVKQRDPANTRVDDALAVYYNRQADAASKAGKIDEAVGDLESAAQTIPSRAAVLYVQAANFLAQGAKPDWKRVKAEADKALAARSEQCRREPRRRRRARERRRPEIRDPVPAEGEGQRRVGRCVERADRRRAEQARIEALGRAVGMAAGSANT